MAGLHANSLKEEKKAWIFPGIFRMASSLRRKTSTRHNAGLSSAARCLSAQTRRRIPEPDPDWPRGACERIPLIQYFDGGAGGALCGVASSWSRYSLQSVAVNFLSFWLSSHRWINLQAWNSGCSKPDTRGYPRSSVPGPGSATGGPVLEIKNSQSEKL